MASSMGARDIMRDRAQYILVLNASEGRIQFLVARGDATQARPDASEAGGYDILCAQDWQAASQGAELLAPALSDAFDRLGVKARDLDRIACVRGPGSFTGLRLVLATAAGLARSCKALLAGLDYLPLLAANAFSSGIAELTAHGPADVARASLWVVSHARRKLVHMQCFAWPAKGKAAAPLSDILVCTVPEAAALVLAGHSRPYAPAGQNGPGTDAPAPAAAGAGGGMQSITPGNGPGCLPGPLLLGSGLSRNRPAFAEAFAAHGIFVPESNTVGAGTLWPPEAFYSSNGDSSGSAVPLMLPECFDQPSPQALLAAALAAEYGRQDITALYARASDAEENLEQIARSLGLDPVQARQRLNELTAPLGR
ncbi:tRNA (adenosine(37)-N6)-threonylcarbamoyltransferase complex dimerization subunit type 1 TsaB [Desulfovibrio sp. OttesenSCG-928-A18]|nr:tRNA (adenosine(37)-N6)-threonylcarbamoyltransferase complex dimerization subunit type 1 TsaB [Desulfovibrio sp. OttesenSCG-928-A18]